LIVCWCDCETTGLDPAKHGIHEIALIITKGGEVRDKRVFTSNPMSAGCEYDPESAKAHGKTEEVISAYRTESDMMPYLINMLALNAGVGEAKEKMVFAGYNCPFDYGFVKALFERYGESVDNWFTGKFIDVYELVKKAGYMGKLPKTENKKLGTMCKSLGVNLQNAHGAEADILATRELAIVLFRMGVKA
jgi:DNA polymerase-3 subunit epsilon